VATKTNLKRALRTIYRGGRTISINPKEAHFIPEIFFERKTIFAIFIKPWWRTGNSAKKVGLGKRKGRRKYRLYRNWSKKK